jgi:two-component system LytT family response regulator
MIKTIIVEDEIAGQELIKQNIIKHYPQLQIVAIESSLNAAIKSITAHNPDLVFLDIHIKGGSGFDVLTKFKERNFDVIFVTAYSNFAIQAIKENALDYIVKPVNKKEFCEAVDKVIKRKEKQNDRHSIDLQNISVKTAGKLETVSCMDILFLEAEGTYTKIFTTQKVILSAKNLGEYELLLPQHIFYRTHHSFIVNISKIEKINNNRSGTLQMPLNYTIPVSQRKIKEFNLIFSNYNEHSY